MLVDAQYSTDSGKLWVAPDGSLGVLRGRGSEMFGLTVMGLDVIHSIMQLPCRQHPRGLTLPRMWTDLNGRG